MPRHKVQEGEFLSSIALQYQFQDGGDAIWNSNPPVYCEGMSLGPLQQVTGGNREILSPGWEFDIPLKQQKQEDKAHDQSHAHAISQKQKNLSLILFDVDGTPIDSSWKYRFDQGVGAPQQGTVSNGKILIKNIDQTVPNATLTVTQSRVFGLWKFPPEDMHLKIGGLDPIVDGDAGKVAIQKILINLGYYKGPEDGQFSPDTRAALRAFQRDNQLTEHGMADDATCKALIAQQKNLLPQPKAPEQAPGQPSQGDDGSTNSRLPYYSIPLKPGGTLAEVLTENVTTFSGYLDPTSPTQNPDVDRTKLKQFHFFPHEASVAPSDPGSEDKNPNAIRMPAREFVFLDTGRWLKDHHDFGVIWGSHVYLCEYVPDGGAGPIHCERYSGLDIVLFTALNDHVRVNKWTSVSWASAEDFDWSKIYLVIPDLHLMDGKVGETWKPGFYSGDKALQSELDLLAFAHMLAPADALKGKLQVVQIGDSYDLWVGDSEYGVTAPLFAKDDVNRVVSLIADEQNLEGRTRILNTLKGWIQNIQGLGTDPWVSRAIQSRSDSSQIMNLYGAELTIPTDPNSPQPTTPDGSPDPNKSGDGGTPTDTSTQTNTGTTTDTHTSTDDDGSPTDTSTQTDTSTSTDTGTSKADGQPTDTGTQTDTSTSTDTGTPTDDDGSSEQPANPASPLLNPAEAAMRLLEQTFGMVHIWGNHDNYLGCADVCTAANLPARQRWLEVPGLLIEHGHRLEATFVLPFSANYDGCYTGYELTQGAYADAKGGSIRKAIAEAKVTVADKYAAIHDQSEYQGEYAQVWLGRQTSGLLKPPHIFVIGHTHMPNLWTISINAWRF